MKGEIQCGLHPCVEVNSDNSTYLQIKACGFFGRGYHCHGIVVMSCKHTFHPFFLSKVLWDNNICCVCGHVPHLNWWKSFGFCGDDDIHDYLIWCFNVKP